MSNLQNQQRLQGIEVFLDVDGTLMNDSAIITIFGNLKSKNYMKYLNLLNDEESLSTLIFETVNYMRPNVKQFFQQLNQMKEYFSPYIQFSVYTSNPCVDLYKQVIQLIQKIWGINVITSYNYTPGKIKYIEAKSRFEQQCIIDNNNTVENQCQNKLIRIKTFAPKEAINENVYNVFKNYLLDEFGRHKEELFKSSIYSQVINIQENQDKLINNGYQEDSELLNIFDTLKERVIETLNQYIPNNKCKFFQISTNLDLLMIDEAKEKNNKQQQSEEAAVIQLAINNEILVEN